MEKNKRSPYGLRSAELFAGFAVVAMGCGAAFSQTSLETTYRTTGDAVVAAFAPQQQAIQKSSAVILQGRKEIAYGVIVAADGYILTKASEVEAAENLEVRVDRELFKDVKVVATDPVWDVALLKVDAEELVPLPYAPDSKLDHGTWVVVNGVTSRSRRRVLAGVISANAREIPASGGAALGVQLAETEGLLEIKEVGKESGAEAAGLKAGDVITAVEGKEVNEIGALSKILGKKKAGEKVKLTVSRDGKKFDLEVTLSAKGEIFENISRNDQMSGDYSKRRSGFPRIIQHDILAAASTMGGPVVDLKGRLVGMNIARANRCETFAIPVEELKEIAEGMVSKARQ